MSVIVPTRDRRPLLARALESVLGQQEVELEVIVVDDASNDGSAEYVHGLGDPRVILVRHLQASGVAGARNAGLAQATAPWVAFLDDDDIWAPDKLAAQLERLEGTAAAWSCTGAVVLDASLHVFELQLPPHEEGLDKALLAYNIVPGGGSGVLARASLVRDLGGFDSRLRVLADWDLWIRLALAGSAAHVEEPLVGYVRHDQNMVRDLSTIWQELEYVARKHASARSRLGVELNADGWLDWIADTERRSGRRRTPLRLWLRLARQQRRPRLVVRALAAAAWPGWVAVRDRQRRRTLPPEPLQRAEAWLAPIRARTSGLVE